MKNILITNSFEETQRIGEEFVRSHIRQGATLTAFIVALYGDLGSGKTTFIQGMAKGLGITKRIISPTFIIVRTYKLKSQNSKLKTTVQSSKLFYHIDLYRLENKGQIEGLGLEDIINDQNSIVAIEWAEKMGSLLQKKRIDVRFKYIDENRRRITIAKLSS